LAGRSLVVEGPPGTGKSQTITNLIAALLEAGKTVLFVAEKMAALNVVKSRLDAASLGTFCLECHSTKGSRAEVYATLKRRLQHQRNERAEAAYSEAEARLRTLRDALSQRVEALS